MFVIPSQSSDHLRVHKSHLSRLYSACQCRCSFGAGRHFLDDLDLIIRPLPTLLLLSMETILVLLTRRHSPIEDPRIDPQNSPHVAPITRHAELAKCILPLHQPLPYCLAHFILAVLAVVAGTRDGVDRPRGVLLLEEYALEVLNGFFRVQAVEINI